MPPFRILRVAKRGLRQPLFPQYYPIAQENDSEKDAARDDLDDEESAWQSEPSSRSSSGSYTSKEGMLRSRRKSAANAYEGDRAPKRRCHIYFSVILGSFLVGLALWLLLMGQRSAKEAEAVAQQKPERLAVWEKFPKIERFYGGVGSLVPREQNVPEYPVNSEEILAEIQNGTTLDRDDQEEYPEYTGPNMQSHTIEDYPSCVHDETLEIFRLPSLQGYEGIPQSFPDHVIGSYEELGLDSRICFDRFGKLGPYGLGYSSKFGGSGAGMEGDRNGSERVWEQRSPIDFRKVRWSQSQQQCLKKGLSDSGPKTAVLLRTWSGYSYDAEDVMFLRSLIAELALTSSGQYSVHFLVQVEDEDLESIENSDSQRQLPNRFLPEEFHDMATFWSESQMSLAYPDLEHSMRNDKTVYSNDRASFMPVQRFAQEHPEYDFFWNWEMDVRYTGHIRQLLDKAAIWSRKQPRKGLWERSARFYIPSDHGSWEDFFQMVRVQSEHGSGASQPNPFERYGIDAKNPFAHLARQKPVWGPLPPQEREPKVEETGEIIMPPKSYHDDLYEWGLDEDADLLTLNPIFNPEGTTWGHGDDMTGYNISDSAPPRRASIGTTMRLSKRLLHQMHHETAALKRHMSSEMWPTTVALHRGLKAVYIPHPVFIDRKWPVDYLGAVFNGGRNGAAGGARLSIFSDDRDSVFRGTTWYEDAGFAAQLWRRWLGYRSNGEGGEQWELANEGRMCVPPMLLHPVKGVDLVYSTNDE